jgi:tetratricopeptide (TPR) repeat protein
VLIAVIGFAALVIVSAASGVGPIADRFETSFSKRDFTMQQRVLTQPRVLFFHASQIVGPFPGRFSLEHDFVTSTSLFKPFGTFAAWAAAAGWIATGILLLLRKGRRRYGFFVLWLPVTLAMESSFLPLEMVFEHRMYLPMVGLAGLAAAAIHEVAPRIPRSAVWFGIPAALTVLLLSSATMARVPVWKTPLSLFRDSARNAEGSPRNWANLGRAYLENGDFGHAEEAVRRALDLDPGLPDARESLGIILLDSGDLNSARGHLEFAMANGLATPSVANHLGEVELAEGNFEMAELRFSQAIQIKPWVSTYRWNRALALERLDRCPEAYSEWRNFLMLEHDEEAREMVRRHMEQNYLRDGEECVSGDDESG